VNQLVEGTGMLTGKVALVAGATRGAGRGIAAELGAAGATVYCSGRSTKAAASDLNRPETIEGTAELVTQLGGVGVAVKTDHTKPLEVNALVEQIRREQGRLDLLVNDIWGGEKLVEWGKPFWELNSETALRLLERSIFTHIITARLATPLMLETANLPGGGGLILEITDGDDGRYRGNFVYDLVKNCVIRMAAGMASDLAGGVLSMDGTKAQVTGSTLTVAALTPGFLRSEEMLEVFGVTPETWRDAKNPDFVACSETPRYIGRAVAALAADPQRHRFAGQALSSWGLCEVYAFTDLDGTRPHWGNYFASLSQKG
jgi:NAD(P)-dependent dehydrogenase (short-subunit alcohol dehydrogenase family)